MSKNIKLETLLQKAETIDIENFEAKNSMTPLFLEVVELVTQHSAIYLKREGKTWEFTPKMIYTIMEKNNSKYFADFLWTQ